ncbi:MAG: hydroxyethylthiazole kinase [Parachlamydiaceae bacterium]
MRIDPQGVWLDIQAIKKFSPLVHNITNYVVMEQTANSLLAIGASPVMAHAVEETEDMARIANSLVLNIGTLSSSWIAGMMLALKVANSKDIPIIFDPVGSGATSFRTETSNTILNHGMVTVIRGNASEILSLNGNKALSKGVDSLLNASDYLEQAKTLAIKHKCIIWMSGKTDVVTDGQSLFLIHNGHMLMGKVTGMGCTATAISGAFLAVNKDPLMGSVHAAILMGIAGEIAAENVRGPGSFKLAFIDTLYNISLNDIEGRVRLEYL